MKQNLFPISAKLTSNSMCRKLSSASSILDLSAQGLGIAIIIIQNQPNEPDSTDRSTCV